MTQKITITHKSDKTIKYYRLARYITLGILVIFIIATLILGRAGLTSENMQYLWRSLSPDAIGSELLFTNVEFKTGAFLQTGYYQGDLAVLTDESFSLINIYGDITYTDNIRRRDGRLSTSDKYVLVYDYNGNDYNIYNSFGSVINGSLTGSIKGGIISDSGVFALITKDSGYRSTLKVYNKSGTLIANINKANNYINSVAISSDGRYVAMLSFYSTEEDENNTPSFSLSPELLIYDTKTTQHTITLLPSAITLQVSANSKGFIAVTGAGIYFTDKKGAIISQMQYKTNNANNKNETNSTSNATPKLFYSGKSGAAIVYSEGEDFKNRLVAYDIYGSEIFSYDFSGDCKYLLLIEQTLYILNVDSIICATKTKFETFEIAQYAKSLLCADSTLLLIYSNKVMAFKEAAFVAEQQTNIGR